MSDFTGMKCDVCNLTVTQFDQDRTFYSLIVRIIDKNGEKPINKGHICTDCFKKPLDLKKFLDTLKAIV